MKSHTKHDLQSNISLSSKSNDEDVAQFLEHQGDSDSQSITLNEGMSIWEARQMFHRVLAGWASDVLTLRQSHLHVMKWKHAGEENDLGDDFSLAA